MNIGEDRSWNPVIEVADAGLNEFLIEKALVNTQGIH